MVTLHPHRMWLLDSRQAGRRPAPPPIASAAAMIQRVRCRLLFGFTAQQLRSAVPEWRAERRAGLLSQQEFFTASQLPSRAQSALVWGVLPLCRCSANSSPAETPDNASLPGGAPPVSNLYGRFHPVYRRVGGAGCEPWKISLGRGCKITK